MRRHHLLLFACTSAPLAAQNWALLNPTYKYNYSLGGTDTITSQLFVTHIDTLGTDSIRLTLNTVASTCSTCTTSSSSCDPNGGIVDGLPQFIGGEVRVMNEVVHLIGADTLTIHPFAALGASWPSPAGGTGTVAAVYEDLVLGEMDSLKQVLFTDGRSLLLSKDHGLVNHSDANGSHVLIGIQGALEVGAHYPETIDFFDYQPGDVLQYEGGRQWFDGMCYHQSFFTRKYTVLTREDLTDRTDYQMRYVFNWYAFATGGCEGDAAAGEDTVTLSIGKAGWTEGNFFAYPWIDRHWPGALAKVPENTDQGELGSNEQAFIWRSFVNTDGRVVLEPERGIPDPYPWVHAVRCDGDSLFWPEGFGTCMNRYVEGIGLDTAFVGAFEHTDHIDLVGYTINGETHGTILPDDIVLTTSPNVLPSTQGSIFPNPASGTIQLPAPFRLGSVQFRDISGRVVLAAQVVQGTSTTDVSMLPPGTYFVNANGSPAQRLVIAR